jgi:hypothetical protein
MDTAVCHKQPISSYSKVCRSSKKRLAEKVILQKPLNALSQALRDCDKLLKLSKKPSDELTYNP